MNEEKGAASPIIQFDTVLTPKAVFTCSDCDHYSGDKTNFKQGFCHANPPTIFLTGGQQGIQVICSRPVVQSSDKECRFFVK